jgi:hypothetical protein
VQEALDRLNDGLAGVTPAHVYANLVSRIVVHGLRQAWRSTVHRIRGGGGLRGHDDGHGRTELAPASGA